MFIHVEDKGFGFTSRDVVHWKGRCCGGGEMPAIAVIIGLFHAVMFTVSTAGAIDVDEQMLFDFTSRPSVDDWIEQSDTVRTVGMSKAVLVLQKTQVFQRAVFFALLNPQPNGAGFAGMRVLTALDLSPYSQIRLRIRAQGNSSGYKMVLRHKGEDDEPYPTYEQFFQVHQGAFEDLSLPLSQFIPYYRGRPLNSSEPLDQSNITSLGLQVYGGVYLSTKQAGPSTLEMDWIKAIK
uniref:NADH:ubiquinone oxidoreductase intermediate-associated protein 30 domain-containing protein n=1 Tax=Timema monikensis TaxID=170555 RepID=A0A7R9HQW9_9NEOP|nr:unnamed protein product [Timema monikensis]